MDIDKFITEILAYAESHPIIAGASVVVFLYLLYRRPKTIIGIIVIGLFWGFVMKMVAKLFETGVF